MSRLKLALTISGAVSLGAFEGGALAALLTGLQALDEGEDRPIEIDVIGGASAGSITGLLAAWVLQQGADPVALMEQATCWPGCSSGTSVASWTRRCG